MVMKMPSTSQEVDDQAASWAVLRDFGGLTPEQQAQFEQWLHADKRHLGAYARAEGALIRVDRAQSGGFGGARVIPPEEPSLWGRRRLIVGGLAAAGVAAIGYFGRTLSLLQSQPEEVFATGVGQVREILLADGSVITLNTNSKVAVKYTKQARDIRLLQGEALFDVAKNKHRPFIVQANNTSIRAVGTSFSVSMLPQRPIQVLVREGVVEVRRTDTAASVPVRVSANTRAVAPQDAPISASAMPVAKLERNMAWKDGRLAFDDETLEAAAEEYARYSDVRIVVDPAVAQKTITGVFVSNDPIGFAKGAASVLGLAVVVNGDEVRIIGRSNTNG
jgi:transmembrane sensor